MDVILMAAQRPEDLLLPAATTKVVATKYAELDGKPRKG